MNKIRLVLVCLFFGLGIQNLSALKQGLVGEGLSIKDVLVVKANWLKVKKNKFDVNLLIENKTLNKVVISNVQCAGEGKTGAIRFDDKRPLRIVFEAKEIVNIIGICEYTTKKGDGSNNYSVTFNHVIQENAKGQEVLSESATLKLAD